MTIEVKKVGDSDIQQAIKDNDGYCVCAVEKTPDTKCMCKEFREQEESGLCNCGLYRKTITKD